MWIDTLRGTMTKSDLSVALSTEGVILTRQAEAARRRRRTLRAQTGTEHLHSFIYK